MTQRLYYTDAYCTEFSASVVEAGADGTRVYLSETAFYPTSGGQPHDLGQLGGIDIADVIDEGERIVHVLASPLARGDAPVSGVVDWARRGTQANPNLRYPYRVLAVALALSGRIDEARMTAVEMLRRYPDETIRSFLAYTSALYAPKRSGWM